MNVSEKLLKLADKEYASFSAKLTPGVDREKFIGVRVPELRSIAKDLVKTNTYQSFLNELPHRYFDEFMLHGLIISQIKDYDTAKAEVDRFLPFVDNWAVCDTMNPKVFGKNRERLIKDIKILIKSKETYTCRFGIKMLMTYFLDDDFKSDYLKIVSDIKTEEYYVKMMVAWFFATALAKQWQSTIPYIEKRTLDGFTHNKTIQKAVESYRITQDRKKYLKTLKV